MNTVREYALSVLSQRQLKSNTIETYLKTIKFLGLEEVDMTEITLQSLFQRLIDVPNINTRRKYTVVLRSIFRDEPWIKELKIPKSKPRVYNLPDEQTLRFTLMLSPFELHGLMMMYAGLRVGEACAVSPSDVHGNVLTVYKQRDNYGKVHEAKTVGDVIIPQWLAERIKGMTVITVTSGSIRESFRRVGKNVGIHLNPHMLRHWYATELVRNRINPEIARQQMRHSDLKTTLGYYAQVSKSDIESVISDLFDQK